MAQVIQALDLYFPRVIRNMVFGYCTQEPWMPCSRRETRRGTKVRCHQKPRWDHNCFSFHGKFDSGYCVDCFLQLHHEDIFNKSGMHEYVDSLCLSGHLKTEVVEAIDVHFRGKIMFSRRGHLMKAPSVKQFVCKYLQARKRKME